MYLTVQNQLTLLHDLLDEQMTYKSVSNNEYQQIKKLVRSMIGNKDMDSALLNVLPEIYYYGMKGENAYSLDAHIIDHQEKIQQWLQTIQQTKMNI
ncbi:MAG TPA: YtzH-like family protein [Pseudogracilibacillus sp.]|nr:YtzH-like family protein [Pseudogracilibacillus sp.]